MYKIINYKDKPIFSKPKYELNVNNYTIPLKTPPKHNMYIPFLLFGIIFITFNFYILLNITYLQLIPTLNHSIHNIIYLPVNTIIPSTINNTSLYSQYYFQYNTTYSLR